MSLHNAIKVFNDEGLSGLAPMHHLHPAFAFNGRFTSGLVEMECRDQSDVDGDNDDDDDDDNGEEYYDDDESYGEVGFENEPGTYWDYDDEDDE